MRFRRPFETIASVFIQSTDGLSSNTDQILGSQFESGSQPRSKARMSILSFGWDLKPVV
jgi:hypothetical protein